jgi:RHS repeat-associated protein
MTSDETRTFQYDAENELTNVSVATTWQVGFIYDGLHRRRITKQYAWQGGAFVETNEIRYVYDGLTPIQERDTNNNVVATYTRGVDLSLSLQGAGGVGGLLARTDSTGSYFYHNDGSGNVTALVDISGNIQGRAEYDAFGKMIKLVGPMATKNTYWYSGKEYIPQAGLYGFSFRFYEPNFQRWLNRDPFEELGGPNLFGFVGNSPINEIDPFGLVGLADTMNNYGLTPEGVQGLNALLTEIAGHIQPGNGIAGAEVEGPLMTAMEDEASGLSKALKGSLNAATKAAASCGSKLHADRPGGLPDQLRSKYPETEFQFTPPGKPGQDVQVVGGMHPSAYGYGDWPEGVNFGDFKPNTPGGLRTFNSDSQSKWNAPTTMLQYDPNTGKLVAQ